MRKVYVDMTVRLIINANEDADIDNVLSEMEYSFNDTTTTADIVDTEITDWSITDSK